MTTDFTYDVRGRKTSVLHEDLVPSPVTVSSEVYVWDAADRMTAKTVDGVTTSYTHDDSGQLLTETRPGWVAAYTYDANGNRLTRTLNGVTETYVYGLSDKLLQVLGGPDPRTYSYDAAGRLTVIDPLFAPKREMFYDEENRLTEVWVGGGPTATYDYNGLDTRVNVNDSLGQRDYLRDGAYVTAPVLREGATQHVPGISERTGGVSSFALSDYIGTASHQTDASGAVTGPRSYDAFGVAQGATAPGTFGYKGGWGYQEDPDTGFRLLGHRYYDADTGRFLTRDPIKDGRNWYAYGGGTGSPTTFADPTGLDSLTTDTTTAGHRLKIQIALDRMREEANEEGLRLLAYLASGKPGPIHFHHLIPVAFHSRLQHVIGDSAQYWCIRLPAWFHRLLHSGKGLGPGGW